MQRQIWGKLLWLTGALFLSLTVPALADDPPATTYQPGYWQPIARVNPNSPVTVTLVNQTGSPLKYNFLDGRAENNLPIGASTQLKNVSLPGNIAIYDPSQQAAAGTDRGLKYETSVNKNDVKVIILPVEDSGFQVINLSKTGAIYVY